MDTIFRLFFDFVAFELFSMSLNKFFLQNESFRIRQNRTGKAKSADFGRGRAESFLLDQVDPNSKHLGLRPQGQPGLCTVSPLSETRDRIHVAEYYYMHASAATDQCCGRQSVLKQHQEVLAMLLALLVCLSYSHFYHLCIFSCGSRWLFDLTH